MNEISVWIEHLRHPLVLAGFGLFIFALIIKPLFLNSKKLNGTAVERLLHKAMLLLFVLAAMAVAGGLALSWKATPSAVTKQPEPSTAAGGMELYEKRLRNLEQLFLAREAEAVPLDEQERRLNQVKLKAVQAKLADAKKSWEKEQKLRKETDEALISLKGQLPAEQLKKAKDSLAQGDKEEAEKAFDAVADKESAAVALAAHQSGKLAEDRLDYAKAMRQYKKAVTLEEANPDYLLAAEQMARTLGDYGHAQEWIERLLQLGEKKGKADTELAFALNELALVYDAQGRYAEAEPLYKRALAIREQKLGKDHPDVADTLNNLAWLYYRQARYAEAEPLSKRALEIREQKLGKDHSDVASTLNNLAALYESNDRYAEAEPLYKRALAIREQKLGKNHPDVANALNNLALLYYDQGNYAEAEPLYKRALAIREQKLGKDHPDVATALHNLAKLYKAQGRYEEAEPLYKRALAIREQKLGKDHPYMAITLNNLALLYYDQGRYAEAEPLYKRALEIREQEFGKDHHDVAITLNNLAELYEAQEKHAEAEPLFQRALAIFTASLPAGHPHIKKVQENYDALKKKMAGR
ncbi:tetratricopeptide repeat protein [Candidatus Electronema sp. JM]|uniref:tetratricopeptide repeat protein n=1 Tax=Candidatus Electronema sp. JM TaxID=3401571 RepID=UPI003AA8706A